MRLILLGDLHFFQLGVWPWQLLSKRLLGQTNLWLNRRHHFRPALWPQIHARIGELKPDGLLGSGDFTTTALPGEFAQARDHWQALVDSLELPLGAHVVPGNHDRYCYASKRRQLFERAFAPWTSQEWPRLWNLGEEACVIGLDPTRPHPYNASGKLGDCQRSRLAQLIESVPRTKALLVLCHYPIGTPPELPEEAPGHGLIDSRELLQVLAGAGRTLLYLHGHIHWPWVWNPPEARGVTVVNAGAPMLTGTAFPQGQGFAELELRDHAWSVYRHRLDADGEWLRESPPSRSKE
jgi:3',5'-cyclic AMP phosphodiesterase CpdA